MAFAKYLAVSTANHVDLDSEILGIGNLCFQYKTGASGGIAFGAIHGTLEVLGWYQTWFWDSASNNLAIKETTLSKNLIVLGDVNISEWNEWRLVTLTSTDVNDDLTYEIFCTRTNNKIVLKGQIL